MLFLWHLLQKTLISNLTKHLHNYFKIKYNRSIGGIEISLLSLEHSVKYYHKYPVVIFSFTVIIHIKSRFNLDQVSNLIIMIDLDILNH